VCVCAEQESNSDLPVDGLAALRLFTSRME